MKLCCFSVINVKTTLQAFTFIFSNIDIGALMLPIFRCSV